MSALERVLAWPTKLADRYRLALWTAAEIADATVVALAVSGGPDSLALLDCVDRWRRRRGAPEAVVLTVDHRLRSESGDEATMVAGVAAARGLLHRTLVSEAAYPEGDIEAAARG